MESVKIDCFLEPNNGYGGGSANGNGDGYGNGDGSGYGNGGDYGRDYGNGYGDGRGCGSGGGIKSINGHTIYNIDGVPTVITSIHKNIAKGYILKWNAYLAPCYIAKGNGYFAHGDTIAEAQAALEEKIIANIDVDERINRFTTQFKPGIKYPAKDFYKWHNLLTGSCEPGRRAFAEEHGIDIETAEYTVEEFIDLTKDSFGGEVIRRIADEIGIEV